MSATLIPDSESSSDALLSDKVPPTTQAKDLVFTWSYISDNESDLLEDTATLGQIKKLFTSVNGYFVARSENPRQTGLRAGPVHVPAPMFPDFHAAFSALPMGVAIDILFNWIQNEWYKARVKFNNQHLYQLMRILRTPTVWPTWVALGVGRKRTFEVSNPQKRLKTWAKCSRNYRRSRGQTHIAARQAVLNGETDRLLGRLCHLLMDQTPGSASVACPFCNINIPDPRRHGHWALRLIIKLFVQGQIKFVDEMILFDLRHQGTPWYFFLFSRWILDWLDAVRTTERRNPNGEMVENTWNGFVEACRVGTRAVETLLDRWDTRGGVVGLSRSENRQRHKARNVFSRYMWVDHWLNSPAGRVFRGERLEGVTDIARARNQSVTARNLDAVSDIVNDEVMYLLEMRRVNLPAGDPYNLIATFTMPFYRATPLAIPNAPYINELQYHQRYSF
ncbi:hypothetical protein TWF106_006495 [Orbilia oligospora]|uniref:Uncharacterized protein n=1 Tax=Orbilia oligospora TaxID=2813651 RepID=A0A7C8QTN1_ORBOL|nr:hypothetical protein TWF106_006495 [Orbilia oligospora]